MVPRVTAMKHLKIHLYICTYFRSHKRTVLYVCEIAHWSAVAIHDHYSAIPDHHSLFAHPTIHRLHGSTATDRAVGSGVDQKNVCACTIETTQCTCSSLSVRLFTCRAMSKSSSVKRPDSILHYFSQTGEQPPSPKRIRAAM